MATTTAGTEKSRKQLYLVIGLGVVLAGILAFQLPKLLGGGGAEATPPTSTDALPTSTSPDGPTPTVGFTSSGSAVVGGVRISQGATPKPAEGQLASFSLFDRRDPFVQLVNESAGGDSAASTGEEPGVQVKGGGGATGTSGTTAATGTTSAVSSSQGASQFTSATLWVNGAEEAVDVKKRFPKADPTFVLVSLKGKTAQIGVVGGAFTKAATITIKLGQAVTLVNTTTGARYTVRLLYAGSQPEKVQQFTQAQD